jgi:ribosome-binding protein aMBF1 (putative translation factor)
MSWGEIELEPEVVEWFGSLTEEEQARVGFHVDRLAARGLLLDEPHTKQLDGKLRELRFLPRLEADSHHVLDRTRTRDRVADGVHEDEAERATRGRTRQARDGAMHERARNDRRRAMSTRTKWTAIDRPDSDLARAAAEDEARISQFRELVFRLRTEAGLTQAELARRMGTTQSAIARIEGGGARPSLDTLERLAAAVGKELVVGVGDSLSENRSIAKLVRDGHAVVRAAS